jgi:hypothetical protein
LILKMHSSFESIPLIKDIPKYEPVLRDLITSQHQIIMTTKRTEELLKLAKIYEDYLILYPDAKETPLMSLNLAELYFHASQHHLAGKYYLETALGPGHSKIPKKDIFGSALEAYLVGSSNPKLPSLELIQNQTGYKMAAQAFMQAYPSDPKNSDIQFNIGKIIYDEQNFQLASKILIEWLQKYPRHKQAQNAALLYLDCFYLRNQLKEMTQAANRLQSIAGLDSKIKAQVKAASEQTQMKAVRSIAGEFGSKDYAVKFAEFARKNKNSKLGEQALYEAFTSLRAQNNPQAFDIGEEYVATYPHTERGKAVFLSLTQVALNRYNFLKAASYLAAYAQKYEQDPNSKSFLEQAALIFELHGKAKEAMTSYKMAGAGEKGLEALVKQKQWKMASQEASKLGGLAGSYYHGLSLYRLGDQKSALRLLTQVSQSSASSPEDRMKVAHAAVILTELQLETFAKSHTGETFSPQLLQNKTAEYQALSQLTDTTLASQGGKWVIAGLYQLTLLNRRMAHFLHSAKAPSAMNPNQLKELLKPQIDTYLKASEDTKKQCETLATENEILTRYASSCEKLSSLSEKAEASEMNLKFSLSPDPKLLSALTQNPKDEKTIVDTTRILITKNHIPTAHLILLTALEAHSNQSDILALLGVTYLHLKDYDSSQIYFKKAFDLNPKNALAQGGLKALTKAFGSSRLAQKYHNSSPLGSLGNLHPWLNR